jgi:NodT family efflux transporter outer membrane factor (OMF) lipoprotein
VSARRGALLLVLGLSGCMVGPDYHRPPPATPPVAEYKETMGFRPAIPRELADRGAWWMIYNDPELDQLAIQVEISNQTLAAAEAAYRQARALIRQARSPLFPTVDVTGSAERIGTGAQRGTGRTDTATDRFAAGATLTWEFDLWGRIRRTIEANSASAQASAADLAGARLSAQGSLIVNYFSLRISDQRRKLLEESVANYGRSMQIIANQVDAGVVSRVDLVQAQTLYQATRASLVNEGIARAQFEHAIAALTGRQPAEVAITPAPPPAAVPTVDAGVPSALLERRPDIASAERLMAEANAQIGVAEAAFFPDISLGMSIGFQSVFLGPLLSIANAVWAIGPQLAATVIDGGARSAQVEAARANYDRTVAFYRQTVLTAFREVEDQLAQQRILEQEEAIHRAAVAAAREGERLAFNQYRAGTIPYATVLQTQISALSTEQNLLTVRLNRLIASANLIVALGGGWRTIDLPSPIPVAGINFQTPPSAPPPLQTTPARRSWWPFR